MATWEIWLDKPDGERIALLDTVGGFAVSKVANAVGACAVTLPIEFDDMIGVDYILEFWRRPIGGSLKLFNTYFVRRWRFQDEASGQQLTFLWGFDPKYLLGGRVVAYNAESAQASMTDELDDMMRAVYIDNFGADAAVGRDLTSVGGGITVQPELSAAPSVTMAFAWTNVLKTLQKMADTSRFGGTNLYFDLEPTFTSAGLIGYNFVTKTGQPGLDRTWSSSHPAFFGRLWGNLESGYIEYDHSDEINYMYGRGRGTTDSRYEGDAEDTTRQGSSIWNRREGYANASAGGGGMSDAITQAYAQSRLEQARPVWRAGGVLLDTSQARYDIDWTFGDKVVFEHRDGWLDVIVDAVAFAVDGGGAESADFSVEAEGS